MLGNESSSLILICLILIPTSVSTERLQGSHMESQISFSNEDKIYIEDAKDQPEKEYRQSIVLAALELNGSYDNSTPGMAVSYIPKDNYYIRVDIKDANEKFLMMYEQALNWDALGKGKGGLAGASVRWKLRNYFNPERETRIITSIDKNHTSLIKEYSAYLSVNNDTAGVWYANAWNVVGLAASCFIRECHHWDGNNTRPVKALLGSLSQQNEITENEYRKLFYLAVHPLPLNVLSECIHKSRDEKDIDINQTVKTRLKAAPSGYADICACAIAAQSFLLEDYASRSKIAVDVAKILLAAEKIKENCMEYHPFAVQMGYTHKEFVKAPLIEAMVILAAYAKSMIGGSLGNSAALSKFSNLHERKINKLSKAFKEYNDRKSEDLIYVLTGAEDTDIETLKNKISPLAKLADKLRSLATIPNSPLLRAAELIEDKIVTMTRDVDKPLAPVVEIPSIEILSQSLNIDPVKYNPLVLIPFTTKPQPEPKPQTTKLVSTRKDSLGRLVFLYEDGIERVIALDEDDDEVVMRYQDIDENTRIADTTTYDISDYERITVYSSPKSSIIVSSAIPSSKDG